MYKCLMPILLLILIFIRCDQDSSTEPTNNSSTTGKIETVIVHSHGLENNLLGDSPERSVSVYLPKSYDENPNARFPVIYLLHKYTSTNANFISNLKYVFDEYFSQSSAKPMIVVIPDAYNAYCGSFYTNSSVTGNWENFIKQELVEYIDNNYRTLSQPSSRGISGYLMGGYGAMYIAMKNSNIFSTVYSLSSVPLVFQDDILNNSSELLEAVKAIEFNGLPWYVQVWIAMGAAFAPNVNSTPFMCDFPIDTSGTLIQSNWNMWLQYDTYSLIDLYRDNLLELSGIKFDCATMDFDIKESSNKFHQKLTAENIPHFFEEYQGNHISEFAKRIKNSMLPFFSGILVSE